MQPSRLPRIKICCISSKAEAWMAIRYGACALGLVSEMPSGPGVIPESSIAEIASVVPPGVTTFLLTSKQSADEIIAQHQRCRTNCIQLVDELEHGSYSALRRALPGIYLVQVVHVTGPESVQYAVDVAAEVDAILLDSGNPNLSVKELGGTGRTHNWEISKKIREQIDKPLFLAGGLRTENVRQAVEKVAPFGLDLCSSVRTDGQLDETKLAAFFDSVFNLKGNAWSPQ